MIAERWPRWTAVAIAVLGLLDPTLTLDGRTRPTIGTIVQAGPSMELPAGAEPGTRRAAAERAFAALRDRLGNQYEVRSGFDSTASMLVVIGDRYPDEPLSEAAGTVGISTVTVSSPLTPNARIAAVEAPRSVPPGTVVPISVTVEAAGMRGATSTVVVRSLGAEVARATHLWSADPDRWTARVSAVPVGEAPFTFDVTVEALPDERTLADNHAVVRVEQAPRLRVLVFDGRPSWGSAFVRRALEGDPRFEVSGLTQVAPRAAVRTGASPALPERPEALDRFDAIVVGGLDGLTEGNLTALERFMVERGGAVAVLPDARPPASTMGRLLAGVDLRERLLDRAAPLPEPDTSPRLAASELLEASSLPTGAAVLARSPSSDHAVVWTIPRGEGRLLFSGALDSWRSRADREAGHDRFWRSAMAGLALAARPAVDVDVFPRGPAAGERVKVTARVRRLERERLQDRLTVAAALDSGETVRLWPEPARGAFAGSFVVQPSARDQTRAVTVTLDGADATGAARFILDDTPREGGGPPLALLAESHGGVNATVDDLAALERHVRTTVPPQTVPTTRHPMRTAWWMIPFAACLSGEWWLRRRAGRR